MHWFNLPGLRPGVLPVYGRSYRQQNQGVRLVLQGTRRKQAVQEFPWLEWTALRCSRHVCQGGHTVQRLQRLLWRFSHLSRGWSVRPPGHPTKAPTLRREYRLIPQVTLPLLVPGDPNFCQHNCRFGKYKSASIACKKHAISVIFAGIENPWNFFFFSKFACNYI